MKLTIELVPKSNWYKNVRSEVSKKQWDIIRKDCYKKANYQCEICGENNCQLECHEVWKYYYQKRIQKLIKFIALCTLCHKVKHIGLAQLRGELDIVKNHLMKVNNITEEEVYKYIRKSFELWEKLSQVDWQLDLDYLKDKI